MIHLYRLMRNLFYISRPWSADVGGVIVYIRGVDVVGIVHQPRIAAWPVPVTIVIAGINILGRYKYPPVVGAVIVRVEIAIARA